jgi:hypothetical protein
MEQFLNAVKEWKDSVMSLSDADAAAQTQEADAIIEKMKEVGEKKAVKMITLSSLQSDEQVISWHHIALVRRIVGNIDLDISSEEKGKISCVSAKFFAWAQKHGYV